MTAIMKKLFLCVVVTLALFAREAWAQSFLGDALDNMSLTWTTGGNANWGPDYGAAYFGDSSAVSGTIGDFQESWVQTTVTGPGNLSFWWKVSSEAGSDFLEFYVNSALQSGRISGETAWARQTFTLPAGTHQLRWRYAKDSIGGPGSDRGSLDKVEWTPSGSTYLLAIAKPGAGSGTVTSSPAGINCGTDCSEIYAAGTVVTLTASASTGSTFSGWSGGGCSGSGTCTVTMNSAASVMAAFSADGGGGGSAGARFVPVSPCRLVDTRNPGAYPISGAGFLEAGTSRSFALPGACGLPGSAVAYALNATVVPQKGTLGYLTLWPTGQPQPLVSTLNSPAGVTVANAAIVPAGIGGAVSAFVTHETQLILDVTGYFLN